MHLVTWVISRRLIGAYQCDGPSRKRAIDATRQDRRALHAYETRAEHARVGEVRVGRLNQSGASADQLGAVSRPANATPEGYVR
jgi:hypothetical protein